ncbi:hypothetical protein BSNK01_21020 [Bacillaceae bacterium]
MIPVIVSSHAKKRLREERQRGILIVDIVRNAERIPGRIPTATRFRGFVAASGRVFDIVAKDIRQGRLVITVIGK